MIVVADSSPLHYLILIALAETMRADLLLIDEAAGRREANRRHILVTGTLDTHSRVGIRALRRRCGGACPARPEHKGADEEASGGPARPAASIGLA
jgi:hypothetical protein